MDSKKMAWASQIWRQCKIILQLLVGSADTIRHTVLISHQVIFIFFPALKKNLACRPFGCNAEVKESAKRLFRMQSPEFFLEDFLKLIKRCDKCVSMYLVLMRKNKVMSYL
ncbi:hypothetical protein TNCV_3644781 [Trichonephila clavipes]|nr:hypothetical protein TNCV_3644781 [Trichonephila clavipes]